MRIITVTYGRTVNLGNYESARLDATAQVEEAETAEDALGKLRTWIEQQADAERLARKPSDNAGWK